MSGNRSIRSLREFLGPEVLCLVARGIILGFLLFAVEASFVLVMQGFLVALGVMERANTMLPSWVPNSSSTLILAFVTFGLLRTLVQFGINYTFNLLPVEFFRVHRARIIQIAFRGSAQLRSSEILGIFTDELKRVSMFLTHLYNALTSSTTAFFLVLLCLKIAPIQFSIASGMLAVALVPIRRFGRKLKSTSKQIDSESQALMSTLMTGIRNQFFVRISGMTEQEIQRARTHLNGYCDHDKAYQKAVALNYAIPNGVGLLVIAATTYISTSYLSLSGAKMISFIYLFLRIAQSASDAMVMAASLKVHMPSVNRLRSLYEEPAESKTAQIHSLTSSGAILPARENGISIRAENLAFRYPTQTAPVFKPISFMAKKGDVIAILGESGAGKSTLLSLISGLLVPSNGSIQIDGISPTDLGASLWKRIGYVGPDPFLIQDTVRNNLLYGHPSPEKVSEAQLREVLSVAELDQLIAELPSGIETVITERGNISTGQKQRISIARALLRSPAVLILDESTAHLDTATERKVLENMKALFAESVTFAATHRPAVLDLATSRISL